MRLLTCVTAYVFWYFFSASSIISTAWACEILPSFAICRMRSRSPAGNATTADAGAGAGADAAGVAFAGGGRAGGGACVTSSPPSLESDVSSLSSLDLPRRGAALGAALGAAASGHVAPMGLASTTVISGRPGRLAGAEADAVRAGAAAAGAATEATTGGVGRWGTVGDLGRGGVAFTGESEGGAAAAGDAPSSSSEDLKFCLRRRGLSGASAGAYSKHPLTRQATNKKNNINNIPP